MAQAKGILPLGDDRAVLYKSPRACGYFIAVKLNPALDRPSMVALLEKISTLVDALVARATAADKADPSAAGGTANAGDKVAAVAVGFAPTFFMEFPRFHGHLSAWPVWVGQEDGVHVKAEGVRQAVSGGVPA